MLKKTLKDIKNAKPFSAHDLILYAVVIVITALSFLLFFTANKPKDLLGFDFYLDNVLAATYRFSGEEFFVKQEFSDMFLSDGDTITCFTNDDKTDYNIVFIDKLNKSAVVKDANCHGKDCLKLSANQNGGFIYCAPHKLKVVLNAYSGNVDPVIG